MKTNRGWVWGVVTMVSAAGAVGGYCLGQAHAEGIPQIAPLSYTGMLTDASGTPLTGTREIRLEVATEDRLEHCETEAQNVALRAGAFRIDLPPACVGLVKANPDLWVEVFVDGTSLSRSKLGAVPYAIEADRAAVASTAETAVGDLEARLATLEDKDVLHIWSGGVTCRPLADFARAGYSNVVIRAPLYSDSNCTTAITEGLDCHSFCANAELNGHGSLGCCGVEHYYSTGLVDIIAFRSPHSEGAFDDLQ